MAKGKPQARRPGKRKDRYERGVVIGIVVSLLILTLVLWGPLKKFGHREQVRPAAPVKKSEQIAKKPEIRPPVIEPAKPREPQAVIALVIDDLGQDMKPAKELIGFKTKITFAIMPGLPHSKKIAELAQQNGLEVMLHLPMEPKNQNGKRQAVGTLRSDMTPSEFMATISSDIESVPGADGVNNHEGSALTENREAMKFLMAELKARNLSFLDSLTGPKSAAYATAKEFGLKAAKRDVFLDNEDNNPQYIHGQLEELARIAKKRGRAVGIGHPHPATISEIRKWLPEIEKQGIEIVPVSKLMQ